MMKRALVTEEETAAVINNQRSPTLAQLIKLLTDPHSAHMVDRHEKYTARLCGFFGARGGVLLAELVDLFKVKKSNFLEEKNNKRF